MRKLYDMMDPFIPYAGPALTLLVLFVGGTLIGFFPARKLITVREASHDLKRGSASWFRELTGWTVIVFWLATLWFAATIVGDWGVSGDLEGAIERSRLRLRILLEALARLSD